MREGPPAHHLQRCLGHAVLATTRLQAGVPLASERPSTANWKGGNFRVTVGHLELAVCSTCCS